MLRQAIVLPIKETLMGQHTIVVIPHDNFHTIKRSDYFGEDLIRAIGVRGNPNIPALVPRVHNIQLGPQFHSCDTLLVSINDGIIERLSIDEQIYLDKALRRFRKKKSKERKSILPQP